MDQGDLYLYNMMRNKMHYLTERQGVLAKNVANADTPDYKGEDLAKVDFRSLIPAADPTQKSAGSSAPAQITPMLTHPGHMRLGTGMGNGFAVEGGNNFERTPKGNEVSLDEQAVRMNENSLDYQATTGLYRKINDMMRSALGGNNS